jgi:sugar phosphate isomerase/epimerase
VQIVMFTKMLGSLPIERVGAVIADLGFDGADLTVRPQGHVLPERVAVDLPRAQEVLARYNLPVAMVTTAITDASAPHAEAIFKSAAQCGISYLKLGYWPYAGFGHIREQMAQVRARLAGIEALARTYGVKACIHTHSGDVLSALAPVVAMLLDGFDRTALGAYVDPGHMTVEGGLGGWKQGLDLLRDDVALVGVKSFGWFAQRNPASGDVRREPRLVPLAEGTVRWAEVFALLRQIGFDGVVSVHSEYQGPHSWRELALPALIEQTRADLAYLRMALGVAKR